jgi:hypothetical protein
MKMARVALEEKPKPEIALGECILIHNGTGVMTWASQEQLATTAIPYITLDCDGRIRWHE